MTRSFKNGYTIISMANKITTEAFMFHHSRRSTILTLTLALTISAIAFSACSGKNTKESESETVTTTTASTPTPSPSPSPTPTPDPATVRKNTAIAKAEETGMKETDLRGQYDLFLRYCEKVDQNPSLNEFRGFVYTIFPVVADHLKPENEELFLEKIRTLKIEFAATGFSNDGTYSDWDNTIEISLRNAGMTDDYYASTVYHELMHFVDAWVDGEQSGIWVNEKGEFRDSETMSDDDFGNAGGQYLSSSFITEGGAELFTAKYFTYSTRTYYVPVTFLTGLEYIYGSETLDSLFFSHNSGAEFAKLMQDAGFTNEEIVDIAYSLARDTYGEGIEGYKKYRRPEDSLIRIYEKVKGPDYQNDRAFLFILDQLHCNCWSAEESEHQEFLDKLMEDPEFSMDYTSRLTDNLDPNTEYTYNFCRPQPIYLDGKYYLSENAESRTPGQDASFAYGKLMLEYDFSSQKVLSYDFREPFTPAHVPTLLDNENSSEAKERVDSLKRDNSAAHEQKDRYGKIDELKPLYDRAMEIGNKYGVYIYIADLVPEEGVQEGINQLTDAEQIASALDRIDAVLGQYPEGFFDQLAYGHYDGTCIYVYDDDYGAIAQETVFDGDKNWFPIRLQIRHFTLDFEDLALTEKADGNEGTASSPVVLGELEHELIRQIYTITEKHIRSYCENFEIPFFSERIWNGYNEDYFEYPGFPDRDELAQLYEYHHDYFVTANALKDPYSDRQILFDRVMSEAFYHEVCGDYEYSTEKKAHDNIDSVKDLNAPLAKKAWIKADFLAQAIRHTFDTTGWPEQTIWEKELAAQNDAFWKQAASEEQSAA